MVSSCPISRIYIKYLFSRGPFLGLVLGFLSLLLTSMYLRFYDVK